MTAIRIMHVDDESDIREVVAMSLSYDPEFSVRGCASAEEGLMVADEHPPNLILLDVTMPAMDGPAMLTHLRHKPKTANIPIVFMTGWALQSDLVRFKVIGAMGTIVKPFDPLTLAELLRGYLLVAEFDRLDDHFLDRLRSDAATVVNYRNTLLLNPTSSVALDGLQILAHKLTGAAGVFGFAAVSRKALSLEEAIIDRCAGRGTLEAVEAHLNSLLACLKCE